MGNSRWYHCPVCGTRGGLDENEEWRALAHQICKRLEQPTDAVISAAARELEQMIIQSAAEGGVDLDAPDAAIFPSQREHYKAWLRSVLPVALSAAKAETDV